MKKEKLNYDSRLGDKRLGDILLTPTRIYVKSCLEAIRQFPKDIKALAHITGGGLTENVPRVLPNNMNMKIDAENFSQNHSFPPVFAWLQKTGNISNEEMWRTFNCGIGMVLVVTKSRADKVAALLVSEGETVYRVGTIEWADTGEKKPVKLR